MVNKERIRFWVDALRSDEFEQGVGCLAPGNKYCCLGVACEVAMAHGLDIDVEVDTIHNRTEYDSESGLLPTRVMEWYGFDEKDVIVTMNGREDDLSSLNDNGSTFEEIANLIEKDYLND